MGTAWQLRGVEDRLIKDLRETTLSFRKLGEKYGVSRQAIFLFCHTRGITRSTRKQKPEHSEEECLICQDLIGISKEPHSDFMLYKTLKEHLEFQGGKLWFHLTFLRKKGLISKKFGRLCLGMIKKKGVVWDIEMAKKLLRDVNEKDELTPVEVRRILGISYSTLHRYCAEGILECRRNPITKWRFIKRESVKKLVEKYRLLCA